MCCRGPCHECNDRVSRTYHRTFKPLYEDAGDEFVGIRPAPKHHTAVFSRPDGQKWVAAMGKEVIKIFGMGTWEIVDTSDIYEGSS